MSKNNLYDATFAEGSGNMCEEARNDKITTEELIKLFSQLSEKDRQTVRNFIYSKEPKQEVQENE